MGSRFSLRSSSIYRTVEEGCGDSVLLGLYPQVALKSEEGHLRWGQWARAYTFLVHSYLFWENLSNPGVAGWHISPGLNLLDKRNHTPSPCSKRKDSGETHWRNARCALEKLDCWVMTYHPWEVAWGNRMGWVWEWSLSPICHFWAVWLWATHSSSLSLQGNMREKRTITFFEELCGNYMK